MVINVRFIILFLLMMTTAWALDDDLRENHIVPKVDFQTIDEDSAEGETNLEEETRALLPLKTTLEDQHSVILDLSEQSNCFLPTLIDDVFLPIVLNCAEKYPHSIRRLFMVSKQLNERIGKLNMKVWIPSHVLSLSPSVSEVLFVINDTEKCHRTLGPLMTIMNPKIKETLSENLAYKAAMKRLRKAAQFFPYSLAFWWSEGSKRINAIETIHEQRLKMLKPSILPSPNWPRRVLSSLSRDSWTFWPITMTALPLAGICAMELCHFFYNSQTNLEAFHKNLQYTNTPAYIEQYYRENASFPHHTAGCSRIMNMNYCFNVTGYCQEGFSSLTNITAFSERVWSHLLTETDQHYLNLPDFSNISTNNIHSIFIEFFDNICAGKQLGAYYIKRNFSALEQTTFIARLKENSPFLLANWMGNDWGWQQDCMQRKNLSAGLAAIAPSLYYCDPIAVATGMTQAMPNLWGAITFYTVGLVVSVGSWITLQAERCFNLYDDEDA